MSKISALAALAAAVVLTATYVSGGFAQGAPGAVVSSPLQGISVVGEGVVTAQPNVARVTMGVDFFFQRTG